MALYRGSQTGTGCNTAHSDLGQYSAAAASAAGGDENEQLA